MKTTVTELADNFLEAFSQEEIKQIAKKIDAEDSSGIDESLTKKFTNWVDKVFYGQDPGEEFLFFVIATACIRLISRG